jgi:hypothetical protein
MTSVAYLLEKKPNLLSFSLLVFLHSKEGTERNEATNRQETPYVASGLDVSVRGKMRTRRPHLRVKIESDGSSLVSILFFDIEGNIQEYARLSVDCPIDVERSVLTVVNDHLAARLAFRDFHSARTTKSSK